ncbi:MAG: class I SAM-dependent methyltransferase [Steroidobacteraceae bacterium]
MRTDRDYFLGTHDEELKRLGLQHRVWRTTVLGCWRRAGIRTGSRVLDIGAGPGYAAADLAEIVAPEGAVVAVERSTRFVEAGRAMLARHGFANVSYHELDLMADPLPVGEFDASWCRWVACFVSSPPLLLDKIAAAIRPGGIALFHEYVQYDSFRISTAGPRMDEFVKQVEQGWRAAGGEPNVAQAVVALLLDRGFTIREANPRVFCIRPGDEMWQWPATFVKIHLTHQLELGAIEKDWADAVLGEFAAAEANRATLMITPMVLEIVAEKRR